MKIEYFGAFQLDVFKKTSSWTFQKCDFSIIPWYLARYFTVLVFFGSIWHDLAIIFLKNTIFVEIFEKKLWTMLFDVLC